jgi:hypothetical protein
MDSTAVAVTKTASGRLVAAVAQVWPAGSTVVGLACPFVGFVIVLYIIGTALDSKRPDRR